MVLLGVLLPAREPSRSRSSTWRGSAQLIGIMVAGRLKMSRPAENASTFLRFLQMMAAKHSGFKMQLVTS
jgi:hypothetical protein